MSFDFSQTADFGSDAVKWNRYAGRDILPLWIADMDFPAPPAVVAALQQRVARAAFGYAEPWPALTNTICQYLEHEYGWQIDPDWLVWLPGLVSGLNIACRAVEGSVFSATPVYPPFLSAPVLSGKALTTAPLARVDSRWQWDIPAVTAALRPDTRLFMLCHPHNPVGRAWDNDELQTIAELAEQHDLIVCSDEIHSGLILDTERRHQPFATLSPAAAGRSITLMAPSKTFNIAGLGCAFAIIPSARLRAPFKAAMSGIVPHVNALGLAACEAAYADGSGWHNAMIDYLRGNRDCLEKAVQQMPGVTMTHVEASYLAWIDASTLCAERGITQPQRFFEEAGVGLSAGRDFAPRTSRAENDLSSRHVRLNFACPRQTLDAALTRMANAID
jgi:cystathionine beta-lyase